MIHHIKLLRNVGTFDSDHAGTHIDLKRLVLIYAENGSGKTTLAAILRSLEQGDPVPVLERHRLGSSEPPRIVLECNGDPPNVVFENGAWSRFIPQLRIYDDCFINENVFSGLSVGSEQRQNLHDLILGREGLELNSLVQKYVDQVDDHNSALREMAAAIPEESREGLSVDEFCSLSKLSDLENLIDSNERALQAAQNASEVLTAPVFEELTLPIFDVEALEQLLQLDMEGLSSQAESLVHEHLSKLPSGGEAWVAQGMGYLSDDMPACPFCGQNLSTSNLLLHYKVYFSQQYEQLKNDVDKAIQDLSRSHSDGKQADFERTLRTLTERSQFWSTYVEVPQVGLDSEALRLNWSKSFSSVAIVLETKLKAPLEKLSLSEEAINAIERHEQYRFALDEVNKALTATNEKIQVLRAQAQAADIDEITKQLRLLRATKHRFTEPLSSRCEEYLAEKEAKARTESKRDEAKEALDKYRETVFPRLEAAINKQLKRFNAEFTVNELAARTIRSGTTSTYNIVINERPVTVSSGTSAGIGPSFQNTLSAGDRNTLALALFFSTLYQEQSLADVVAVIDDPMTSLDDHRSLATGQEVRNLSRHVSQVFVLSHSKPFLCRVWEHTDPSNRTALQIRRTGGGSTILEWDVKEDAQTESDRRHGILQDYLDHWEGDEREVAESIRFRLEGYLRGACPADFRAGDSLGPSFFKKCWTAHQQESPILEKSRLQKLQAIQEYAGRFHHDTNQAWQSESINSQELHGFVRETLEFVRP